MRYRVMLWREPDGDWSAYAPSLRGCYGAGETMEDALQSVRQAIEIELELLVERGDELPPEDADAVLATVEVEVPAPAAS